MQEQGLTSEEVCGGMGGAVAPEELPVKVIILPLTVLTQAGIGVLVKRAPNCWRKRENMIMLQLQNKSDRMAWVSLEYDRFWLYA